MSKLEELEKRARDYEIVVSSLRRDVEHWKRQHAYMVGMCKAVCVGRATMKLDGHGIVFAQTPRQ